MLTKKYVSRTDLKVAGFSNFQFYGNHELKKVFLSADIKKEIGKQQYNVTFTVEADRQNTSIRNIEKLCRLMLEELESFNDKKAADKKKFAEEHGDKIDY
jgi:hypothetical protein